MIKVLYPELKLHHWIGFGVHYVFCALARDSDALEVVYADPVTAALIYGGVQAAGGIANFLAQRKQTKPQREAFAKGAKMMGAKKDFKGLTSAEANRIRTQGMQNVMASTRGIEADVMRGAGAKPDASRLATLSILAKQRGQAAAGLEGQVTAADAAAKEARRAQFQGRASALMGVGPAPAIGSPVQAIAKGGMAGMDKYAAAKQAEEEMALERLKIKSMATPPPDPVQK